MVHKPTELQPRIYNRLTDRWLGLTVRFVTEVHGIRDLKDRMSREILHRFDEAGIGNVVRDESRIWRGAGNP